MPGSPFVSYAQNREDVVLWRALGHIPEGRYVDVGANDPRVDSVTRAFYEAGWSGLTVEPVPALATAQRADRPRDTLLEVAMGDEIADAVTLHVIEGTGLSTLADDVSAAHAASGLVPVDVSVPATTLDVALSEAGFEGLDLHFVVIDVEGAEPAVLRGFDLARWRPWALVVEATAPRSVRATHEAWEPGVLAAGYEFCLFDGLSRFYVSPEHPELRDALSRPASPLDEYDTDVDRQRRETIARLEQENSNVTEELVRWRSRALTRWAERSDAPPAGRAEDQHRIATLEKELAATRATLSWRITAPLRAVRGLGR